MKKFSVNNFWGRLILSLFGTFPLCFYLVLKVVLDWSWRFNLGLLFFISISLFFWFLFLKFAFFDWDFFIKRDDYFLFKRMGRRVTIDVMLSFKIKPIFIGTFLFQTWKIVFSDGKSFYFRYKPLKISFFTSFEEKAKEIESEINAVK